MAIAFNPLHPVFAAECVGMDIRTDLTPEQAAAIDAGMDRYAVLVFRRDAPLETERQVTFTKYFGDLEPPYQQIVSPEGIRLAHPNLIDISNLGPGGQMLDRDDRRRQFNLGNQLWHSDSSYKVIPARYSLLHAHVVPPEGGDTQFADMRAAYDMLPARTKTLIEDLVCQHSRIFSKGALGFPFTEDERVAFAPVRQRLVRTHRKTGRQSLYLSSHGARIEWSWSGCLGSPAPRRRGRLAGSSPVRNWPLESATPASRTRASRSGEFHGLQFLTLRL